MMAKTRTIRVRTNSSAGDHAFTVLNYSIMILLCITTLYPFLYLITSSFSGLDASLGGFSLLPRDPTLNNYDRVIRNPLILLGYKNTILRTVLGTILSVLVTFMLAYPLAKKAMPNRSAWTGYVVFTMFFSGGLIPSYLLVRSLGLVDTIWALILPELVSAYNFVIARNYIMGIPPSLEESARIDGANDIVIFFRIIMPVCKPVIATLALWIAVWHWNSWFDSMIYSTKAATQVAQLVMRRIVLEGTDQLTQMTAGRDDMQAIATEGIKAATIMVTTIPILLVYPFIQKYFVKGVMVGSLKG